VHVSGGSSGTGLQRQLSELLYGELLHSFGSYRLAAERFEVISGDVAGVSSRRELLPLEALIGETARAARTCNRNLHHDLHRPQLRDVREFGPPRRPSPFAEETEWTGGKEDLIGRISEAYLDIGTALGVFRDRLLREGGEVDPVEGRDRREETDADTLGERFGFIHDPPRRLESDTRVGAQVIAGQIDRTWFRRNQALRLLDSPVAVANPGRSPLLMDQRKRGIEQILEGWIGSDRNSLLLTILEAMSEAHMWMHYAEHVRSESFGRTFSRIPVIYKEAQKALEYSLVLNTFVFVAARGAPWIFAEDEEERSHVAATFRECHRTLAPTYCMWLSTQVSLLALHRRAFTWWTMNRHGRAYRDFHKLARILRELRRPAEERALRVPGTKTFIDGMTAMSELHIGRIYRGQHAHRMALRYFKRASAHLIGWEQEADVGEIMRCSHWRVNLLINRAKAHYELGQVTRSILFYARAWRAFLLLVEAETKATANTDVAMSFIEWMARAVREPELSRGELRDRLEPLVEQFRTLRSPEHLRLLAADIVSRMGHLLRVLNLPSADQGSGALSVDHTLARKCIAQAAFLDPASTLIASDHLKISDPGQETQGGSSRRYEPPPLSAQWPSGGSYFESAARITEHTLQRWLQNAEAAGSAGDRPGEIARELLEFFLAHSDSSNVKLAQVYRYLMREPRDEESEVEHSAHTVDFVCLRRYSSFFPFLPRPSAFRAPGGGYLVQVREPGEGCKPFGVAVDPGPDFIENLYRCGYSLADIQMIVISHDHADHIASLDALLALLYHRKSLGDETFDRDGRDLIVVGNESVCERYGFYNEKHPTVRGQDGEPAKRRDSVRVVSFEDAARMMAIPAEDREGPVKDRGEGAVLGPVGLRIEPVRTYRHLDAHGHIAQGFLLSFGPETAPEEHRPSILFAGDTGLPEEGIEPPENLLADGGKSLRGAVREADLVVAHLSSAPLPELRRLAGLNDGTGPDIDQYQNLWAAAVATARSPAADRLEQKGIERTQFLLKQVQFGFRSRAVEAGDLSVSPFSRLDLIKPEPPQHLYLSGLIAIAEEMVRNGKRGEPLLLIGELREELGTFRTRIARGIAKHCFREGQEDEKEHRPSALTADIGLRVRLSTAGPGEEPCCTVLCTTCDLDTDLLPSERFHVAKEVEEVCVKGEDEGVFYACAVHDPQRPEDRLWIEAVERYDVFGE
jgi:hypothetical protein